MSTLAGTGGPPPPHRFGTGEPFSVGLEEELLLVDSDTLALSHVADQVLPGTGLPRERIDHEAFLAELEVRSDPAGSVGEAIGQLAEGRAAAAAAGATLMAVGLHPDARLFDVKLVQSERYERVERQMRGLIKRTPECALHVHVGLPDPDAAVAAMNGLRELLPLLHGLGANSPFWFGADSGMASSRAAVIRAYPGRGIPPVLDSWDDYLAALDAVRAGRRAHRPHDGLVGRPAPATARHSRAARGGCADRPRVGSGDRSARARDHAARGGGAAAQTRAPEQALHWSSFRAARDGLDAEIYYDGAPATAARGGRPRTGEAGPRRSRARGRQANRPRGQRRGPAARRA